MTYFKITNDQIRSNAYGGKVSKIDLVKLITLTDKLADENEFCTFQFLFEDSKDNSVLMLLAYQIYLHSPGYSYLSTDDECRLSQLDVVCSAAEVNYKDLKDDGNSILHPDRCFSLVKDNPADVTATLLMELCLGGARLENPVLILRPGDLTSDVQDYMRLFCRCRVLTEDLVDQAVEESRK